MHSLRFLVLALVAVFGITGCIQVDKVVKLKPDGSGTIEETVVMSKEMVAQMKQMTEGFSGLGGEKPAGGAAPQGFHLMDEKKLREAAGKMGEGVTFVSAKPVMKPSGEGFVATYAFADINKLKLSQDLGDSMPQGGPGGPDGAGGPGAPKPAPSDPVTFQFTKGAPASLTITSPQPKQPAEMPKRPAQPEGSEDMAMMMMQQMFKDMKMSLAIEFVGRITQTNATNVSGSRVTLAEMDFNKVLANPEKFKALTKAQPKSLDEAKVLLKGVDGIKMETQPKVTVKFQ